MTTAEVSANDGVTIAHGPRLSSDHRSLRASVLLREVCTVERDDVKLFCDPRMGIHFHLHTGAWNI